MEAKRGFHPPSSVISPEIQPAFGYYCIAQIKDAPSFATA
jgi:hypothetical protein